MIVENILMVRSIYVLEVLSTSKLLGTHSSIIGYSELLERVDVPGCWWMVEQLGTWCLVPGGFDAWYMVFSLSESTF